MDRCPLSPEGKCIWEDKECLYCVTPQVEYALQQLKWSIPFGVGEYFKTREPIVKCSRKEVVKMTFNEIAAKYLFGAEEAARVFDSALNCSTQMGSTTTVANILDMLTSNDDPFPLFRIQHLVEDHNWTLENVAIMVDKLGPLVDVFTFEGLMARISPLLRGLDVQPISGLDGRRSCLVNNRKHWFLRWQDRKWVVDPSPMVGGHAGGQCQVTMAIVEEQETGQVSEVYPREVRFLDSVGDQHGENA